jgi:formylglycine-generating enzyme required for sulfatase activity
MLCIVAAVVQLPTVVQKNVTGDMGIHSRSVWLRVGIVMLIAILAACIPASPPPTTPTPVSTNTSWTPQLRALENATMEMVLVPTGCFVMGNDEGRRDERPQYEKCFDAPYWIGRTEVTNAQYGNPGAFEGDNVARGNVTWFEARDFCANLGLRLPTEAEWEFAARGPESWVYPWGNEFDETRLVYDRNSNSQLAEVGSRPTGVSWVGALDMIGNAMEWTSSLYERYPYDAADGREDAANTTDPRVYRSSISSYIDFASSAAIRFRGAPDMRDWFIGFRCAQDFTD